MNQEHFISELNERKEKCKDLNKNQCFTGTH